MGTTGLYRGAGENSASDRADGQGLLPMDTRPSAGVDHGALRPIVVKHMVGCLPRRRNAMRKLSLPRQPFWRANIRGLQERLHDEAHYKNIRDFSQPCSARVSGGHRCHSGRARKRCIRRHASKRIALETFIDRANQGQEQGGGECGCCWSKMTG